jgi:hypothetical protein
MRNNTVGQALDALLTNLNNKLTNLKIFEWARVYLADRSERLVLWALANGRGSSGGPWLADLGELGNGRFRQVGTFGYAADRSVMDLAIEADLGADWFLFFFPQII